MKDKLSRINIKDRVFKIIQSNFTGPKFTVKEEYRFNDIEMSPDAINALSEMLIEEFDLISIDYSRVIDWLKISDVINHIENQIQEQSK